MMQKRQFSLMSLLLVMLLIAMGAMTFNYWTTSLRTARMLAEAEARVLAEQKARDALLQQHQAEFFGHFPPPILGIDRRQGDAPPLLYAVLNSKPLPLQTTLSNAEQQVRIELQLLRTLNNKDYYRLRFGVFGPDEQVDLQRLKELLFAYDGSSLTLINEDNLSLVLSPSRAGAIETVAAARSAEEAKRLKEKWLTSARVEFISIPSVRGSVDMNQFNK